ncbi:MAG: hypothetical protein JWP56_658 [Aeromicrobium sp.]|jgi:hypothetical protein|nr:hypothetical protein [Aeromicrobium sp.]
MVDRRSHPHRFVRSARTRSPNRGAYSDGRGDSTFDLSVFEQAEYWTDEQGRRYPIAHMDTDDRRALIAWLGRNAQYFYVLVLARELVTTLRVSPGRGPPMMRQAPEQWLHGTTLMVDLETEPDRKGLQ